MSTASREQIMNALATIISEVTFDVPINGQVSFVTVSRRLQLWGNVPADSQPAAFIVEHEEHDEWRNLGVERRRLNPRIWCYARTDDPTVIGGSFLNTILEAFDSTFGMSAQQNFSTGQFTLSNLAYWCRIEGRVFKDPGDIDGQALLIVPLIIEVP